MCTLKNFIYSWMKYREILHFFISAQVSTDQTLLSSSYQLIYLVRTFVSEVFGEIGNIFPKLVCLLLNFLSFPNSKCKDYCKGLNWISKTANKKRSTIIFVTGWTRLGYNTCAIYHASSYSFSCILFCCLVCLDTKNFLI